MLRFIKGGSGFGKSTFIQQEIVRLSENTEREILLLVPEQFSFEAEREYYGILGAEKAGRVKVLSFMRLADEVFREYGGMAGDYASQTSKILTMRLALKECRTELRLYGKNALRPDFVLFMIDAVEEMKNAGVSPQQLEENALVTENAVLKDKLFDFSLIYGSYDAILAQDFLDTSDSLERMKEKIVDHQYFEGKLIFVDEFKSFTAVQKEVLRLGFMQSEQVTISLCMSDIRMEYGLFDGIRETENQLKSLSFQIGCKVLPPMILEKPQRFSSAELAHFSQEILKNNPLPFTGKNEAVMCVGLHNEFDESEYVAAEIWKLVQQDGLRFEDIVVIGRDMDSYGPILEAAFDRYEIPYFMDRTDSVDTMPLMRFVTHLLGSAVTNFSRKELIPMLKCGIFPLSLEEISDFESYIYVWNVDKDGFLRSFCQNPMGFSGRSMKKKERLALKNAEQVRQCVVNCVLQLKQLVKEEKISVSEALYRVLADRNIPAQISVRIKHLMEEKRSIDADNEKRVWEVLMEILDAMDHTLSRQEPNFREFRDLFLLSAATYDLGHTPQTLDSVLIGSAERIRVQDKKAAIVIGANDKAFPFLPSVGGMFTDRERREMKERGLELSNFTEQKMIDERFVAYKALTSPSEKLIITFSQGDISGREKYPSVIVSGFSAIFPNTPIRYQKEMNRTFFCQNLSTAFLQYAKVRNERYTDAKSKEEAVFAASVQEILNKDPLYREKLHRLASADKKDQFYLQDRSVCAELFSGNMVNRRDRINRTRLPKNPNPQHFSVKEQEKLERLFHRNATLSPSQIEKYYTCGFQYFCRYGLDLKARQKAELSPMHRGNVIHYLLDILLKEYDIIHLSEADLEKLVDRYLLEYLNQVMGGAQEKPQKFLYFYRRLGKTLKRIFSSLKEEFSQTAFQVVGLEEPIRADSSICPLHISVDESHAITVIGKVDRVDLYSFEEENFVRIVDYKSGSKEFDLNGMAAGLHLQMLLYLFAIWRTQNEKYKNVIPAGILYMLAGNPKPILDREASEDAEQDAVQKSFSMNGLLLNSQTVLCAMEKNLEGKFIPVSRGKSGLKGKYLASRAEFAALEKYTMELVQQMGESLFSGNVRPDPIQATVNPPCNYCDYRAVCGHEEEDGYRSIPKVTMEEITGISVEEKVESPKDEKTQNLKEK